MFSLLRGNANSANPVVQTLLDHTAPAVSSRRKQKPFEFLVRHLLTRLLHSEAVGAGEEASALVPQIALALAMPGFVFALFLYMYYHFPYGPRPFWSQVSDHLFYVTYSFTIMGIGTVLQWDLLFPDRLDVLILTPLPISGRSQLLARGAALSIFLGAFLIGLNLLGIVTMPVAADLLHIGLTHFVAHAVAVLLSGLAIAAFLVALQGVFLCTLGEDLAAKISPVVQTLSVLLLLATLLLYPLFAHFLLLVLRSHNSVVYLFPPFWFLGIYERLLHGSSAPQIFMALSRIGLWTTALSSATAVFTYPLAFKRRLRQIVEGTTLATISPGATTAHRLLHVTLLRDPRQRAIYHFISQTLSRSQRIRILLAIFGGFALAIVAAAISVIRLGSHSIGFELSPIGMRFAVPVIAFWTVVALRAAMRVPIAKSSSWIFRAIHGRPERAHLDAAERWVALYALATTTLAAVFFQLITPPEFRSTTNSFVQILIAVSLPVLLTDIFLLWERAIPFTTSRPYSVNNLSYVVVTYIIFFPSLCLAVVALGSWMERSLFHIAMTALCVLMLPMLLHRYRLRLFEEIALGTSLEEDSLAPGEMGLRD